MSTIVGKTVLIHHFLVYHINHFLVYHISEFGRMKLRNPIPVEVLAQRGSRMYGLHAASQDVYTFELEDVETATILDHQDGQLAETGN